MQRIMPLTISGVWLVLTLVVAGGAFFLTKNALVFLAGGALHPMLVFVLQGIIVASAWFVGVRKHGKPGPQLLGTSFVLLVVVAVLYALIVFRILFGVLPWEIDIRLTEDLKNMMLYYKLTLGAAFVVGTLLGSKLGTNNKK